KSSEKWTPAQKQRAKILFKEYPELGQAYGLCHSLRMILAKNTGQSENPVDMLNSHCQFA
ncbi:transposase, partial [Bacteroides xylanisolvens]|nr:transposase [Bacteroides xylanisolvens]